jgi:hypothetical protein
MVCLSIESVDFVRIIIDMIFIRRFCLLRFFQIGHAVFIEEVDIKLFSRGK